MNNKNVSVIGLGYVGLPTATLIASKGISVIGVDVVEEVVDSINQGRCHLVEPSVDELLKDVVANGMLRATKIPEEAEVFIIAVPTPITKDRKPDISYVKSAVKSIAQVIKKGDLVILESTSPVGTTESLVDWLADERSDLCLQSKKAKSLDVNIAYCPERVLPGLALQEITTNDRIIGGMTDECARRAHDFYKQFVQGECLLTNAPTAELSKLTENSFRDVNIAFANELSIICDKLDIDVWELINLANHHPRVNILQPGPGVGGHCLAVDPWFIVDAAPEEANLIRTARLVNDAKSGYIFNKIIEAVGKCHVQTPVIACLGVAFKSNIDDLRESPAVDIVIALLEKSVGEVLVVEPNITLLPKNLEEKGGKLVELQVALERADIVVFLVDHKEFIAIGDGLKGKIIVDAKGICNAKR